MPTQEFSTSTRPPAEKMPGGRGSSPTRMFPRVLFGPYQNEIYPLDEEIRFVGDTVAAVAAERLEYCRRSHSSAAR